MMMLALELRDNEFGDRGGERRGEEDVFFTFTCVPLFLSLFDFDCSLRLPFFCLGLLVWHMTHFWERGQFSYVHFEHVHL